MTTKEALFITKFTQDFEFLLRNTGSNLAQYVTTKAFEPAEKSAVIKQYYDTYRKPYKRQGLFEESKFGDDYAGLIWTSPDYFQDNIRTDELQFDPMLTNDTSQMLDRMSTSFKRWQDEIIINAFFGDVRFGKDGAFTHTWNDVLNSTVPIRKPDNSGNLPALWDLNVTAPVNWQRLNADIGAGVGSPTGLNVDKLLELRKRAAKSYANPMTIMIDPIQEQQLFQDARYVSGEFGKPVLDSGQLKSYLGFNFVTHNYLPIDSATGERRCIAFSKDSVSFNTFHPFKMDRVRLPQYDGEVWKYSMSCSWSSIRLQGGKVFEIRCTDTV